MSAATAYMRFGCRPLFRKERIHLLGMRCRGKSEGKDKYREDELLHVCIASVLSVM